MLELAHNDCKIIEYSWWGHGCQLKGIARVAQKLYVIARRDAVPTWQSSLCHAEQVLRIFLVDPEINSG
ncbi:hypothetical protein [Rickettsia endosymbiont of Orchestes rusci]|uniref:hypothetical protein n=1 Tax=Rickettsia endosymbiont of Orchestes rusci TaxID=3066250 RepID=UPI00313B7C27